MRISVMRALKLRPSSLSELLDGFQCALYLVRAHYWVPAPLAATNWGSAGQRGASGAYSFHFWLPVNFVCRADTN
jgi:hypothetical protein